MNETETPDTQTREFPASAKAELKTQQQVDGLPSSPPKPDESTTRHAFLVGAGILISRIIGLLRQGIFSYYFGASAAADVFNAAFRIPNFLQNVFGEGALSASLIPVYAGLLAKKDTAEANRVANAVLTLLALVTSILVLLGVLLTPYLITFIAPGFEGEKRELTIRLVKILFPGAGLLVMSAWCLGVLNSHRKFFLSYTAPVIWNCAIIAAMVFFGSRVEQNKLAEIAAWGSVVGSALQFAIQLPTVFFLVKNIKPVFDFASANVRTVVRNFFPVFFSRGVVQISAYVDAMIASFLGDGPISLLQYTQSIYTLPVSLFGMSISAAELPAMASAVGNETEVSTQLRTRLDAGLKRIAVFIVPSSMAFLAFGDVLGASIYQRGAFGHKDVLFVWGTLAGASVGLMASTLGRLYSSTFYALKDTRTPLKFAVIRVFLTTILGYFAALYIPPLLGIEIQWGTVGLTLTAGIAGWVEFLLLRRALNRKIGKTGLPAIFVVKLWTSAIIGAGLGWAIKIALGNSLHPILIALLVATPFGITYFLLAALFKVKEAKAVINQVKRRIPGLR
ncbi:MAG: murein biosynthesis integral membrane protein MurJ [Acidobacteriota bacterium]|nr:murein biosynthesis integral membrane protein MurJ [Acidobacteriota bacterium]